jgi:hypothetical protein
VFVIHLRPDRTRSEPIKALRWILKKAGRLGLKCVSAIEEKEEDKQAKDENKISQ